MRALTTTATATALRAVSTTLESESITFLSIVSMSLEKRFWHLQAVAPQCPQHQRRVISSMYD